MAITLGASFTLTGNNEKVMEKVHEILEALQMLDENAEVTIT